MGSAAEGLAEFDILYCLWIVLEASEVKSRDYRVETDSPLLEQFFMTLEPSHE